MTKKEPTKPSVPQEVEVVYSLPEQRIAVSAKNVAEAVAKGKALAKKSGKDATKGRSGKMNSKENTNE